MKNISVSIVSIGTEILLGEIVNTNSQFLAVELANMGINVFEMVTIGDNRERLLEYFSCALKKYDMVIATGGLGPTVDDISKETACEFFGLTPVINEEQLEYIRKIFLRFGRPMTDNNIKQAMFPESAVILKNRAGSAPGCIIEKDGKKIILLPGPPNEMKQMFEREVKPILSQLTDSVMYSEVVKVCGVGESAMEEMVKDIIDEAVNPTVAPYAKTGECRLRVTAKAENIETAKELVAPVVKKLAERLG
ncbi:MAG TPA: molybdopterin-binding protein, partial [bacterium]|nr:molybdopterin-binding protein [bacterium]